MCVQNFLLWDLVAQKLFYAEFWHATKERNILLLLEFKHIVVEAILPIQIIWINFNKYMLKTTNLTTHSVQELLAMALVPPNPGFPHELLGPLLMVFWKPSLHECDIEGVWCLRQRSRSFERSTSCVLHSQGINQWRCLGVSRTTVANTPSSLYLNGPCTLQGRGSCRRWHTWVCIRLVLHDKV